MPRPFLLALFAPLLSTAVLAAPPDLRGEYWDEWNVDRVEFRDDGKAEWTESVGQKTHQGSFSFPDETTLKYEPDAGGAATWKLTVCEGFMTLTGANGVERLYRRETAEVRMERAADAFVESLFLRRSKDEAEESEDSRMQAFLKIRSQEVDARLEGLLTSLGRWSDDDLLKQLLDVATKRRPELRKELEKVMEASRRASATINCKNGLKQISVYIALYESKFRKYPKDFADIQIDGLAEDPTLFTCPVTGKDDAYVYVFPEQGDETNSWAIMAYDREPHPDGSRNVMAFCGAVVELTREEFEAALKAGVVERK